MIDDDLRKELEQTEEDIDVIFNKVVNETSIILDEETYDYCKKNQIPDKLINIVKALFWYMSLGVTGTVKNDILETVSRFIQSYIFKHTCKKERKILHNHWLQKMKGSPSSEEIFNIDKGIEGRARLTNKIERDIITILEKSEVQE